MRTRMFFPLRIIVALAALGISASVRAMSVVAPTFEQLVAASTLVVRGVVTDVKCVTIDTPQGQAIQTLVTLHVERALKGTPDADLTLKFLGGKVGRHTMSIPGMPQFQVGHREIVFVGDNGRTICPVIAAGHGRYRVQHDDATNSDFIARENNTPLTSTDEIAQPLDESSANGRKTAALASAMTVDAFESRISDTVRGTGKALQP